MPSIASLVTKFDVKEPQAQLPQPLSSSEHTQRRNEQPSLSHRHNVHLIEVPEYLKKLP